MHIQYIKRTLYFKSVYRSLENLFPAKFSGFILVVCVYMCIKDSDFRPSAPTTI